MNLEDFFADYADVAIAFSGGVDSAFLLYEAKKYARCVKAYYVKSQFQPQFEYDDALKFVSEIGADIEVIPANVLEVEDVVCNPSNRCYYCKRVIMSSILNKAREDGFQVLLDGTNASDDMNDRPGGKALEELKILSPLRLCGLTKDVIRQRSREAGLFTSDKPAYACLATRIPTGMRITEELLERTEEAEEFMMNLGFSDFRVRTRGENALIQIRGSQMELFDNNRQKIYDKLGAMYKDVLLDSKVRDE